MKERLEKVDSLEHLGYWEIGTSLSTQSKENPVLLTFIERKIRFETIMKIDQFIKDFYKQLGNQSPNIFKTIIVDNSLEVAGCMQY